MILRYLQCKIGNSVKPLKGMMYNVQSSIDEKGVSSLVNGVIQQLESTIPVRTTSRTYQLRDNFPKTKYF